MECFLWEERGEREGRGPQDMNGVVVPTGAILVTLSSFVRGGPEVTPTLAHNFTRIRSIFPPLSILFTKDVEEIMRGDRSHVAFASASSRQTASRDIPCLTHGASRRTALHTEHFFTKQPLL